MNKRIIQQIQQSAAVKQQLLQDTCFLTQLEQAIDRCVQAYQQGHKTLLAGNGGSAADAQHIAAELINRFQMERRGLPSIALTTDSSVLTSISNDYTYDQVYARQIEALAQPGDIFLGISTSGNSNNIIHAITSCNQLGVTTIGLCGRDGGRLRELCDICLMVPSNNTARIQESHILIGHIICDAIEQQLFTSQSSTF